MSVSGQWLGIEARTRMMADLGPWKALVAPLFPSSQVIFKFPRGVYNWRAIVLYKMGIINEPYDWNAFFFQILELQYQNIVEKRVKKVKNMRKGCQQNPNMVTFLCRKCQKLVFSGGDIHVIENMHHVIPDSKFKLVLQFLFLLTFCFQLITPCCSLFRHFKALSTH